MILALIAILAMTSIVSAESLVVRNIEIEGNTRTNTEVIRRELLFEPGDTLSVRLIEETERNLRALLFLGDVSIEVQETGKAADVRVRVRDLYSRAVTPLLSGEPDELSYGLVGLDYNFTGRGQILELTAEHDAVTGNRFRAFFREPRVSGSRVRVDLDGEVASEGHDVSALVTRPFYRLSEPWSTGVSAYSRSRVTRLYSGQTLSDKYESRSKGGTVFLRRSYGDRVKVRPGLVVSLADRSFTPEPGYTYSPADRRRVLPGLRFTVWKPRYETTRFYSQLGRTEDVQTGSWVTVTAGASVEAVGSDRDYRYLTLDVNPRTKLGEDVYLLTRATFRSRFSEGRIWNVFGSAEGKLLIKLRDVHSLVARIRFDGLGRTEDDTQYLLGAARGLRGYALRRFDGSRRLVFNVEARPTLIRKPAYTVAGAVFLDGGSAWTPGTGDATPAVAAGIGGRVGLNRVYNAPVMRGDVAYGFRDRGWVVYVGLGQYF